MSYIKNTGRPFRWMVYTGRPEDYPFRTHVVECYSILFFARRRARRVAREEAEGPRPEVVWRSDDLPVITARRRGWSARTWLRFWRIMLAWDVLWLGWDVFFAITRDLWLLVAAGVMAGCAWVAVVNIRRRRRELARPDYDEIARLERELFGGKL